MHGRRKGVVGLFGVWLAAGACSSDGGGPDGGMVITGLDIEVTDLSAPATARAGETLTLTYTVRNVGNTLAGGIVVRTFIGRDQDPRSSHAEASFGLVILLDPGEESMRTVTIELPAGLPRATYQVTVEATLEGEGNTDNNTDVTTVAIEGTSCSPDSFEDDDSPDQAPAIADGDEQVHNACFDSADWMRFEAVAGNTYVVRTWWHDRIGEGISPVEGPVISILDEDGTTVLAASGPGVDPPTLRYEATRDGTHYLLARPEFGALGPDSTYSVSFGGPRPDFQVDLSNAEDGVAGGIAWMQYTLRNDGFAPSPTATSAVLLAPDESFETGVVELARNPHPALDPVESDWVNRGYTLPAGLDGTYYVAVAADPDDAVAEMSERNNASDVIAIAIGPPACAPDGREQDDHVEDAVPVGVDTTIVGNHCDDPHDFYSFAAEGGVEYLVTMEYTSTTASEQIDIFDGDGTPLDTGRDRLFFTPASTGTYLVDATRSTTWSGADSEYVFRVERALPNLRAGASITVPFDGAALGTWIDASWSAFNDGPAGVGPFAVDLYLSPDATVTTADRLVASVPVSGIVASSSASGSLTLLVPDDLSPGAYWFAGIADGADAVVETSELDNTSAPVAVDVVALTCTPDGFEPDDARPDAVPIALGETQNRNQCDDAVDWLSFDATAGGSYLVIFDPLGGIGHDDAILIYDTDGTTLLVDGSSHIFVDHVYFSPPANGTYFIQLGDQLTRVGDSGNPRDYDAYIVTCPLDAYEQDDDRAAAKPIAPDDVQTHNLCDDNTDWVSFAATIGTTYEIETNLVGGNLDTSLRLETSTGTLIESNSGVPGSADARISWTATATDTFYVRVQSTFSWGPDTEYTVSLTAL